MTAPRAFVLVQQLHICWGRGVTVEHFICVSSQPFSMILYSILTYFSAALRIWLDDSTASVCSCTVATYLLGQGIDSRALFIFVSSQPFSMILYSILTYFSAALRIWLDDSTASVCSCTVATYLLGEGTQSRSLFIFVSSEPFSMILYSILTYFSAALRIWLDDSTASICSVELVAARRFNESQL